MKDADIAPAEIEDYINNWNDGEKSRAVSDALIAALEKCEQTEDVSYILENRCLLYTSCPSSSMVLVP